MKCFACDKEIKEIKGSPISRGGRTYCSNKCRDWHSRYITWQNRNLKEGRELRKRQAQ